MKKLLPLLFLTLLGRAQNPIAVYIETISPIPICAGDSLHINYTVSVPTNTTNAIIIFKIKSASSSYTVWHPSYPQLISRPKEPLPPPFQPAGVLAYYVNVWIPESFSSGSTTLMTMATSGTGGGNWDSTYFSINPAPTITVTGGTICNGEYFTINPHSNLPATSITYTYTGGSNYVNPAATTGYTVTGTNSSTGCSGKATLTVNVDACTGIQEQSIDHSVPARYFDLQGREIFEFKAGELIIELPSKRKFIPIPQ